ncbi:hypothetical protein I350_00702 [Cryptococcus amylolentus CBS 6273]|uniref:R3H domain-containing protein n=1 Tax=Cryptococcus amylolentus CBS 6273 TaxID=1296118 RepID=A0A1E3KFQ4_9TREE|nr:hypothetical protein I350_00702 [Cryptococcus amylolentus CBS 6273]
MAESLKPTNPESSQTRKPAPNGIAPVSGGPSRPGDGSYLLEQTTRAENGRRQGQRGRAPRNGRQGERKKQGNGRETQQGTAEGSSASNSRGASKAPSRRNSFSRTQGKKGKKPAESFVDSSFAVSAQNSPNVEQGWTEAIDRSTETPGPNGDGVSDSAPPKLQIDYSLNPWEDAGSSTNGPSQIPSRERREVNTRTAGPQSRGQNGRYPQRHNPQHPHPTGYHGMQYSVPSFAYDPHADGEGATNGQQPHVHSRGCDHSGPSNSSKGNMRPAGARNGFSEEVVELRSPQPFFPNAAVNNTVRPSPALMRSLNSVRVPQLREAAPLDAAALSFVPGTALLATNLDEHPSSPQTAQREEAKATGKKGKKGKKPNQGVDTTQQGPAVATGRRAAFEQSTKLTSMNHKGGKTMKPGQKEDPGQGVVRAEQQAKKSAGQESDDLVTRLTKGLKNRPFVECPICFNSITPSQQTWCCLPPDRPPEPSSSATLHVNPITGSTATSTHYSACYTPFHMECIRDWANRSLGEEDEKIRSGLKEPGEAQWRCPGCQKRRTDPPGQYKCFCGRLSHPPTSTIAPHSCGDSCGRKRTKCGHGCPLPCHPGPCPPCNVALIVPCPSHNIPMTVKCSSATSNNAALSPVCDDICDRQLNCGHRDHACQELCHYGPCAPCMEMESVTCYCGEEEKQVECGWGRNNVKICAKILEDGIETTWEGRFDCGKSCERYYDCGKHKCQKTCHPHPVAALVCPHSPEIITHCPCGATPLSSLPGFPRPDCLAPVPTCKKRCPQSRPCGHPCPKNCHTGECPPCHEEVMRTCRCGQSQLVVPCDILRERMANGTGEVTCERVCKALRNCGRHECGRLCCPLWEQVKSQKKKRNDDNDIYTNDDLHQCHLTCGKMLSCGRHTCPKPDHKGPCGRCLQASYDELICHCGRTIIYPPVACGTQIHCPFPCTRPSPECGHPKIAHQCHENEDCPPCPYLTEKSCACGKEQHVKNIRCSQDRVSCGQACGELLSCGFHRCQKLCHKPGECDSCAQMCGKPKSICKHSCTAACHAPKRCPENEPCQAIVTQTCSCGNLLSRTSCGASTLKPKSREAEQLKCNSECAVRQRNARLADALGIKQPGEKNTEVYEDELKNFALGNHKFVKMVESTFEEFFKGPRQSMVLPHMPESKRTIVMSLADHYRLTRELIDQEPNRSVQIRRRIDTRIPKPLLSAAVNPSQAGQTRLVTTSASPWGRTTAGSSGTAASIVAGSGSGSGSSRLSTTVTPVAGGSGLNSTVPSRTSTPVIPAPFVPSIPAFVSAKRSEAKKREEGGEGEKKPVGQVDDDDDWDKDDVE